MVILVKWCSNFGPNAINQNIHGDDGVGGQVLITCMHHKALEEAVLVFEAQVLGGGIDGSGFRIQGFGCGCRIDGSGFRASD